MSSGFEALCAHAPDAARALGEVEAAAWPDPADADLADLADLAELVSRICAGVNGLQPLVPPVGYPRGRWMDEEPTRWRSIEGLTGAQVAALEFAEQFAVDVSAITVEQRGALFRGLGRHAADFTATIFVMDFLPRTAAALDALFDSDPGSHRAAGPAPGDTPGLSGLWDALDTFTRTVPRLDALDPITAELVRLRVARQHRCRLCSSLRSRPALVAGAVEQTFSAIDQYHISDLSAAHKAVLALTDAVIWTPGHVDASVCGAVVATTSAAQRVELVLDITRNALNKVAVALSADAPHVADGVEIYDIDSRGDLVYGLSLD